MTTLAPSVAPQQSEPPAPTVRQYIRYLFYKAAPTWRHLSAAERESARTELPVCVHDGQKPPVVSAFLRGEQASHGRAHPCRPRVPTCEDQHELLLRAGRPGVCGRLRDRLSGRFPRSGGKAARRRIE